MVTNIKAFEEKRNQITKTFQDPRIRSFAEAPKAETSPPATSHDCFFEELSLSISSIATTMTVRVAFD